MPMPFAVAADWNLAINSKLYGPTGNATLVNAATLIRALLVVESDNVIR